MKRDEKGMNYVYTMERIHSVGGEVKGNIIVLVEDFILTFFLESTDGT